MGSDIASTKPERPSEPSEFQAEFQEWRRGLGFGSLRARIFAVNIVLVIVLAIMLLKFPDEEVTVAVLPEPTIGDKIKYAFTKAKEYLSSVTKKSDVK